MTDHVCKKHKLYEIEDIHVISDAIERCNLKREHKIMLKILYVDGGCLEDVCAAVGREYATVAKWHKPALKKLMSILQKMVKFRQINRKNLNSCPDIIMIRTRVHFLRRM